MKRGRFPSIAGVLAIACIAVTFTEGNAQAQKPVPQFSDTVVVTAKPRSGGTRDHFMTFSGPVRVPGTTLLAGAYLFQFPVRESPTVLRISARDGSGQSAMFQTAQVTDVTRSRTSEASIRWAPRQEGMAPAIASWFPEGQTDGVSFIYPTP